VNEALRQSLAEDAGDLAVIEGAGQRESSMSFEEFVEDLKPRGRL